jgi:hypothetical protein
MEDLRVATVVFLACEHEVAWWKPANPLWDCYCIDVCSRSHVTFKMDSSLWSAVPPKEHIMGCCSFEIHYNTDGANVDGRELGIRHSGNIVQIVVHEELNKHRCRIFEIAQNLTPLTLRLFVYPGCQLATVEPGAASVSRQPRTPAPCNVDVTHPSPQRGAADVDAEPCKVRMTTDVRMKVNVVLVRVPCDMLGTQESGEHCLVTKFPSSPEIQRVSKLMHSMGPKELLEYCFSLVRTWPRLLTAVREYDESRLKRKAVIDRRNSRKRKAHMDRKDNKLED